MSKVEYLNMAKAARISVEEALYILTPGEVGDLYYFVKPKER